MSSRLQQRKSTNGRSKLRRIKKPWWNEDLTNARNEYSKVDKQARKSTGEGRLPLQQKAKQLRKDLDRKVQRAKRAHWCKMQEDLLSLQSNNPKEYWRYIGNLGIGGERQRGVPWEIQRDDGSISTDPTEVLNHWKTSYEQLLNVGDREEPSKPAFADAEPPRATGLDRDIELTEVLRALTTAKNGKATGLDGLPVEVLRNQSAISFLHELFKKCFSSGKVPSTWLHNIISPIPKCNTGDPRDPNSSRGITLASCVYKLYCSVLNKRLSVWAEANQRIADEQNGFRKARSCIDHLCSLTEIIEHRRKKRLPTFAAFIDFSKAYDRIPRSLLWYKLEKLGPDGPFLRALKSLYQNVKCAIRINGTHSDFFNVNIGLKQGCLISPALFNLYVNDLIEEINSIKCGITVGNEMVSALMYADDMVLISHSEDHLQQMLNKLHSWCDNWKMTVNASKTKVMHFRIGPSVRRSSFVFTCGDKEIGFADHYRYLGLVLNEFLDYQKTATEVAKAATRALGAVIAKCKAHGDVPYTCFSQLFDTLVQPIIDYAAAVWGHRSFSCINAVQHRACRFFLKVGRHTPNTAVTGEMAWRLPQHSCSDIS